MDTGFNYAINFVRFYPLSVFTGEHPWFKHSLIIAKNFYSI
jgi:hypothetical protein